LEPPLCVVSNWIIRVYTILVWNTISGSSNLDICCYHCLILTLIFHLKVLINFFFFLIFIIIIINSIIGIIIITTTITITTTTTTSIIIVVVVVIIVATIIVVLLLLIIYTINLPVVRPRSYRVIYYFNTPALGRRHQSFGRVNCPLPPLIIRGGFDGLREEKNGSKNHKKPAFPLFPFSCFPRQPSAALSTSTTAASLARIPTNPDYIPPWTPAPP